MDTSKLVSINALMRANYPFLLPFLLEAFLSAWTPFVRFVHPCTLCALCVASYAMPEYLLPGASPLITPFVGLRASALDGK